MFNPNALSIPDIERKIYLVDSGQLTRFLKLNPEMQAIAAYGIKRHIYYCDRMDISYGADAIREIIDDTLRGYETAREMEELKRVENFELDRNYMRLFAERGRSHRKGKTPIFS